MLGMTWMAERVRVHFPLILELERQGKTYLDSAATSQKPYSVINAIDGFYRKENFPVRRSVYFQAEKITSKVETVRAKIADFLGVKDSRGVVFVASATDAINLVSKSYLWSGLLAGKKILLTSAEHHSNFAPWVELVPRFASGVKVVEFPARGYFEFADFEPVLDKDIGVVAVTLDSNVVGPVWDEDFDELKKLINRAHSVGARVLVDATQAVAHCRLNFDELGVDFLVFSGHKIAGPTGVGVLCVKTDAFEVLNPLRVGGGSVAAISSNQLKLQPFPHRLESGTMPIAQIIGLGKAVEFLQSEILGLPQRMHEAALCKDIVEFLSSFKKIRILGNPSVISERGHLVSFAVEGIHAHDIAWSLGQLGVFARAGDHCAKPLHEQLGMFSSVRVSLFAFNTAYDISRFKDAFFKTLNFFKDLL